MEKASMTHKMKVEKFNQHLDSLTEHFDIPKVSWTKQFSLFLCFRDNKWFKPKVFV